MAQRDAKHQPEIPVLAEYTQLLTRSHQLCSNSPGRVLLAAVCDALPAGRSQEPDSDGRWVKIFGLSWQPGYDVRSG